jgi:hypothetical protein
VTQFPAPTSLPNTVTELLVDVLPELSFRTAVLAVGEMANLDRLLPEFRVSEVVTISSTDSTLPQPSVSRLMRGRRRLSDRASSSSGVGWNSPSKWLSLFRPPPRSALTSPVGPGSAKPGAVQHVERPHL